MKLARRLITLAIVMAMVMALAVTASAQTVTLSPASDDNASITITNASKGETYSVYKVFDATVTGTEGGSIAYSGEIPDSLKDYFTKDATTDAISVAAGKSDDDVVAALKTWAESATAVVSATMSDENELVFTGLDYGYYVITSTLNQGVAITVTSTNPSATIIDKNTAVSVPEKKVTNLDDTTDTIKDVSIGETVNYEITGTISRYQGDNLVTKLTFTDTMGAALTANKDVQIYINDYKLADNYTVEYTLNDNNTTDDTTDDFWVTTIVITAASVNVDETVTYNFNNGDIYKITYSATVNKNAANNDADSLKNTVSLKVNDSLVIGTDEPEVPVKTYMITLTKDNEKQAKLAGAKFKLYDAATGGNEVAVVLVSGTGTADSTEDNVYRLAVAEETGVEMVTGTTGVIKITGLGNGTYYFEETEAPAGYTKLGSRQAAEIKDENAEIDVENKSGSVLPSTGGIGTTIFYVLGSLMFLGALVLLVTNKRMRAE